jgi:type II secretion system protein G
MQRVSKAFTLIELLIVVAIIAILAAIAVPNFLEAQTRAKITRGKADMRSIGTALEMYRMDNGAYPYGDFTVFGCAKITTPVAYIATIPQDPFIPLEKWHEYSPNYFYYAGAPNGEPDMVSAWSGFVADYLTNILVNAPGDRSTPANYLQGVQARWQLRTLGPDKVGQYGMPYDATNGTKSLGDIVLFGPGNQGLF